MATREQILDALLANIAAQNYFVLKSRRMSDPRKLGPDKTPACFLVVSSEEYVRPSPNLPPKRKLKVGAFIYNDVGPELNAIPEAALNNAMEVLEAAVAPDNARTQFCTLGGLVFAAYLNGEVRRAPAELTGKALAIAPIEIILP
jgi:hypothetical protein